MADKRHGGPYDRGAADAYYRRPFKPHYFEGASYSTKRVEALSPEEREAYRKGWADQYASGDFKDWGEAA